MENVQWKKGVYYRLPTCLDVWREYDISLTLYPSFTLPFYREISGSRYQKIYGVRKGAIMYQEGNKVCCIGCSRTELALFSGAWFNPLQYTEIINDKTVEHLLYKYAGLGIAIDPWDPIGVFYSVYLSQNTNFHRRTVVWLKRMFELAESDYELLQVDPLVAGGSYQLYSLSSIKALLRDKLYMVKTSIANNNVYRARRILLGIKGVGTKTAHAYLLFAHGVTHLVAVDRHLKWFVGELLGRKDLREPDKKYCFKYSCNDCPIRGKCIVWHMYKKFGEMAGWIQTAVYVEGARRRFYTANNY